MSQSDATPPPQDEYISNGEARRLVREAGLSDSTFYRWASEGRIRKSLAGGRQRGAEYLKADILKLIRKEEVGAAASTRGPAGATDWIQRADLPFVQSLDLDLYGPENMVDMAITWRWWERNPCMCRILYNAEDRRDVWGALTVMPMSQETIFRLLRQEMSEREITPDHIFRYEPGHSYSGYVASVAIRPQYQTHLRSLVWSVLDFWCDLYPSIKMTRLYGFALSERGLRLIRHLFFAPRYDLGVDTFELDLMRSGNPSRLVSEFQRCIRRKEEGESDH